MSRIIFGFLFVSILIVGCMGGNGLKKNYYKNKCGSVSVERRVRDIVWSKINGPDSDLPAKLLRLHYHDCFVRGCDASILLDAVEQDTRAEKQAGPNVSFFFMFSVIDDIKTALEAECPGIVSCADIIALAARDAVSFQFQKEMWPVKTGRKDGLVSLASEADVNLPDENFNFTTLATLFGNKGLNINDLVTLSGAHTLGTTDCGHVARRLYNYTGVGDTDPSLNVTYAEELKNRCPEPVLITTLEMDPNSSLSFDSNYYRNLNQHKGLFVSDAALLTNKKSAHIAKDLQDPKVFFKRFARSIVRMGAIGVLTDGQGEVRKKCWAVNG